MTDATPTRTAWGRGWATVTDGGAVLDTWYPELGLGSDPGPGDGGLAPAADPVRCTSSRLTELVVDLDTAPEDVPDAYLRLQLLSRRLVRPREVNLDGVFAVLPIVAWTDRGPCVPEAVQAIRQRLQHEGGRLTVLGVDRFARMVDYVVPSGVRIADADRVRLGAHLAPGTVVMHEGFVNFNAGTLGASMVEGRISQGVVVGDGTDIGGGASIMGTLSGGGNEVVTIGRDCLIGANGGVGISLGDGCVVEAGCYITAGTKVTWPDGSVQPARELSGEAGLRYWRNSTTGVVEVRRRQGSWGTLNADLHAAGPSAGSGGASEWDT